MTTKSFSIAVPEPKLTADELVDRARALRPMLRAEQAATEQRTAPSPLIHEAIRKAGLYRILQPRRFGGYELSLVDMCRAGFEIARGCPSTGWYYSFTTGHTAILAQFYSEQAQAELFGPDGDFLAPGRAPMGTATRTKDGWIINGKWDYCSGSAYSTHFLAGIIEAGRDGPPRIGTAILHRQQFTILDDWGDTIGMRGTASNSIVVDKQLVPDHWISWENQLDVDLTKPMPGRDLHRTALYAARFQSQLLTECAAWAVGTGLAMLDEYGLLVTQSEDNDSMRGLPRIERQDRERYYGVANGLVETAAAAVLQTARTHAEFARRGMEGGVPFSKAEDLCLKLQLQRAIEMCWQAVELLFRTSGSHGIRNGSRLQRYYRDYAMAKTHFFFQLESHATEYTQVRFSSN